MDFEYEGNITISLVPESETELDLYPLYDVLYTTLQTVTYQTSIAISSTTPKTTLG
jgi:hypothetical protein